MTAALITATSLGLACSDFEVVRTMATFGYATAQAQLAQMYLDGEGVDPDTGEAIRWFREAGESGRLVAQFSVAVLLLEPGPHHDPVEGLRWLRRAADGGYPDAHARIGEMYFTGRGVERDRVEAMRWMQGAAEAGDLESQNNLAVLHLLTYEDLDDPALGKPHLEQALRWLQSAAAIGFAPAQKNLGALYLDGSVVPADRERAISWLRRAAAQENAEAIAILEQLGREGAVE